MDIGAKYKIWYMDDQQNIMRKDVLVIKESNYLLEYRNLRNGKEEGLSLNAITRFERLGRDNDVQNP